MSKFYHPYLFWKKVINTGNKRDFSAEEKRNRRLTNSVILLTLLGHLVILGVHVMEGLYTHLWIISVFILSFSLLFPISCYWSVRYAKYHIIFGTAFLPLAMAIYAPIDPGVFLGFSYAQIYILVLILILFDLTNHEIDLFALVTFSLLYTIFFDELLLALAVDTVNIIFLYEEYIFYKVPLLAVWSIILIIFVYRDIDINKNTVRIRHLNEELKKEKNLVEIANKELRIDIEKRTIKLAEHKDKMEKYSYRNAHDVRGPLARVQGLSYLLKNGSLNPNEMIGVIDMLEKAANELHESISSMDLEMVKDVNSLQGLNYKEAT